MKNTKKREDAMKKAINKQLESIVQYLTKKPDADEVSYIRLCLELAFIDGRISVYDEKSTVRP